MIYEINVLLYNQEGAMLEVRCGKGTYIRTLCQDLGRACGSSAYMTYLMRTASGSFGIDRAVTLAQLEQSEHPEQFLLDMNSSLVDMPALTVTSPAMQDRVQNGLEQRIPGAAEQPDGTICRALSQDGQLLAIGCSKGAYFQPNKVFKCGEQS